ncbi:MAG: hypothetical protein LUD50_08205, partial [Clostridia bacterium]|nr:hypothetical protein [Clostridia bacterium]
MNTKKSTPVKEDQAQEKPAQEAQKLNGAQLQDEQAEQAAAQDIDPETEAEFERRMNEIERQTDEKLRADLENMTPEQRKEFHQALREAVKAMTDAMMPVVEAKNKMQAAWHDLGTPIEEGRKELQEALKRGTAIEGTAAEEADQGKHDSAHDAQEVKHIAGQIGEAVGLTEQELEFVRKRSVDRLGANAAGFVVATVQAITKLTQSLAGTMGAISAKLEQWRTSDTWQALQGMFTGVNDWIDSMTQEFSAGNILFLAAFIDNINDLMPYLQEELDAYKEETGRQEISLAEFMQDKDPESGAQIESIFSTLLNRAKDRARESDNPAAAEAAQNIETARRTMENLPVLESISRIPKNYVITNDALSNSMTGRADKKTGEMLQTINAGDWDLPILPPHKNKKTGDITEGVSAYT